MDKVKITVIKKNYDPDLMETYLKKGDVGPCEMFEVGQEIVISKDDYFKKQLPCDFCADAWNAMNHYIFSAFQGAPIFKNWMKDDNAMIACCSDGLRPVVFKIERIEE